jgi:transcriptional regulator with XRE-family HTH domain
MYKYIPLCKHFYIMYENELKIFGHQVRQKRESMELDRDTVALQLGVHPRTYAKWENGQSAPPLDKALGIANILEQPLGVLLGQNTPQIQNSFNINNQEGEGSTISNYVVSIDRDTMRELNQRFSFLEEMLRSEREEKKRLQEALEGKIST